MLIQDSFGTFSILPMFEWFSPIVVYGIMLRSWCDLKWLTRVINNFQRSLNLHTCHRDPGRAQGGIFIA